MNTTPKITATIRPTRAVTKDNARRMARDIKARLIQSLKDAPLQRDVGEDYEDTPAIVTVEVEFKAAGARKK